MKPRRAFTLIELLIVVVIIGILAAIAIPQFASTRQRAYTARLRSDLRNLAAAQEGYYYEFSQYAADAAVLAPQFVPSQGTTVEIVQAAPDGWSARATNSASSAVCAIANNAPPPPPAVTDGVIACR